MSRMKHLILLSSLVACGDPPPADGPPDPGPAPVVEGVAPVARRLTVSQYDHVMRDLFGDDLYVPASPEPDLEIDGMARVGASVVSISPRGVERYEAAAMVVAEQAVSPERRGWMPCTPSADADPACLRDAIGAIGRRVWRRSLAAEEVESLAALAEAASTALAGEADVSEPFFAGLRFAVAAMLQAPDFLLRVETGESNGAGGRRYTSVEMASRLSFLLWDSTPDEALLAAAERGDLVDDALLAAEVDRMLADPKARRGLRAWTDDLFDLGKVTELQKDPEVFLFLRDGLLASAREETLRLVEDVVFDRDADFGDLLTTRETWVDRSLAMIYGVPAPELNGFGLVELPADGIRVGLFGQASLLSLYAHPRSSSATLRGKFVRSTLLCGEIPPPPADVDTSIPEPSADAPTLRDRIAAHLEVPSCRGCHEQMDPIGLGFENFDGLGVYRETEAGVQIDPSGDLDGVAYQTLPQLAAAVRNHPDFNPCMVEQVVRAAIGREPSEAEEGAMAWLVERFEADEHRLQALLRELVQSPMFRAVGEVGP
jgi:hypothetical protein